MSSTALPVFIRTIDIPDNVDNPATVLEICIASEKVTGDGQMVGAQNIKGLWRLYPKTTDAREKLLITGLLLRQVTMHVYDKNPHRIRDDVTGREIPTTKVWIDHIPISVANSEIELALKSRGCELRSHITEERVRNADNKLTHWLSGRRYVFINIPKDPLPKTLPVSSNFTAKIYHKEQKQVSRFGLTCAKCLHMGHRAAECDRDFVCRDCLKEGHKKGDPLCPFFHIDSDNESEFAFNPSPSQTTNQQTSTQLTNVSGIVSSISYADAASADNAATNSSQQQDLRGRMLEKATKATRNRSISKRRRPKDDSSPRSASASKLAKTNTTTDNSKSTLDGWVQNSGASADGTQTPLDSNTQWG